MEGNYLKCNKCGMEIPDESLFCLECGNKIENTKNFCRNCGLEFKEGTKFCIRCGEKVGFEICLLTDFFRLYINFLSWYVKCLFFVV